MPFFPASLRYTLPYRAIEMRRHSMLAKPAAVSPRAKSAELQADYSTRVAESSRSNRPTGDGAPLSVATRPVADTAHFGAQRGDPSRGVDVDLSTCVNRYGPAPAAMAALHAIEPADILLHPYDAAEQLVDLYRWATGVQSGAMIAGRGGNKPPTGPRRSFPRRTSGLVDRATGGHG